MSPTLNREMARYAAGGRTLESLRDLTRSVEWIGGLVLLLVACAGTLAGPWIAGHWLGKNSLPDSTVALSIALMSVVAGLRVMEGVYRGALFGLQRHVWINGASVLLRHFAALARLPCSPGFHRAFKPSSCGKAWSP